MGIADKISKEVQGWASLAIIIVIASIILNQFRTVTGVTATLNTTINTFVTALGEPQNWVAIVVIAIIGISLFKFFSKRKN